MRWASHRKSLWKRWPDRFSTPLHAPREFVANWALAGRRTLPQILDSRGERDGHTKGGRPIFCPDLFARLTKGRLGHSARTGAVGNQACKRRKGHLAAAVPGASYPRLGRTGAVSRPVRHGLVEEERDWPSSSIRREAGQAVAPMPVANGSVANMPFVNGLAPSVSAALAGSFGMRDRSLRFGA